MFEKGLIVSSLLGDIQTATKQAAGREGGPAGFFVHVSKSNLKKLRKILKRNLINQLGFNMTRQVYK